MKTLQHTAIYFWALWAKHGKLLGVPATYREFHEELPFVLLPDAIRGYIGPRQASHFEMRPDGTANSWMVFPNEQVLKDLSKETSAELVKYSVEPNIPKCVIGEMSCLRSFEKTQPLLGPAGAYGSGRCSGYCAPRGNDRCHQALQRHLHLQIQPHHRHGWSAAPAGD